MEAIPGRGSTRLNHLDRTFWIWPRGDPLIRGVSFYIKKKNNLHTSGLDIMMSCLPYKLQIGLSDIKIKSLGSAWSGAAQMECNAARHVATANRPYSVLDLVISSLAHAVLSVLASR